MDSSLFRGIEAPKIDPGSYTRAQSQAGDLEEDQREEGGLEREDEVKLGGGIGQEGTGDGEQGLVVGGEVGDGMRVLAEEGEDGQGGEEKNLW